MIRVLEYQNIPRILKEIASEGSTNRKVEIIKENQSSYMEPIFKWAYHPHLNFGVSKVDTSDIIYSEDPITKSNFQYWINSLNILLNDLQERKVSGNLARLEIKNFLQMFPKEWGDILLNILNKDLRLGAGAKLINKVYPNLIPEEFCMLAQKYSEKKILFPCYVDPKLDGLRGIATISNHVVIHSRSGKELKNYKNIESDLNKLIVHCRQKYLKKYLETIKLDGEITDGHFQNLMRTVTRKEGGVEMASNAIFNIFDILSYTTPLSSRLHFLDILQEEINNLGLKYIKINKGRDVYSWKEIQEYYDECLGYGQEGIMIKALNGLYQYKRSYAWQKMKPEETEDIKIIGIEEGTGKYVGKLGALICSLPNDKIVKVGSGYTDEERKNLWVDKEKLVGWTVEVKFQEKTLDGSLRFPVFVRFREDK